MTGDGSNLTLSEARLARLVADGRTDEDIARQLAITGVDVDATLAEVFRKLGLRTRSELALLVSPGDEQPKG